MRKEVLILGICMALFLTACGTPAGQDNQTGNTAAMGDTVMVKYVGKFPNGTVFDTNVESVARANGINKSSYQPLEVTIGQGQVISGFENALIGMSVGDQKVVNLSPSEAYGEINEQQIMHVNVRDNLDRMVSLERDLFIPANRLQQLPGNSTVGEIVEVGDISYEVVARNESGAELRLAVEEGDQIQLPQTPWNSTVVDVNDTSYTVRQDPANGSIMRTSFGPVRIITGEEKLTRVLMVERGSSIQTQQGRTGRVTGINATHATYDFNHPLAGETLIFELEVVGIQ